MKFSLWILAIATIFTLAITIQTLAGEASPPAIVGAAASAPISSPYSQLASITGIVAATGFGVEVLKRAFTRVKFVQHIPLWIIAIGVSVGLVLIANLGLGVLKGNVGPMIWQAALMAASASGFYEWLRNGASSPKTSNKKSFNVKVSSVVKPMLLLAVLVLSSCAANPAFVSAANQYYNTVGKSWSGYVSKDATLNPAEKRIRLQAQTSFGAAIVAEQKYESGI